MALPHAARWFPWFPRHPGFPSSPPVLMWLNLGAAVALTCAASEANQTQRPISLLTPGFIEKAKAFYRESVTFKTKSKWQFRTESIFNSNKQSKHNRRKSILHSRLIIHHLSLECCLPESVCLLENGCGSVECSSSSSERAER